MDFDALTPAQIIEWTRLVESDDLRQHASDLSREQLKAAISAVNEMHISDWAAKTRAIIEGLSDHSSIETAGSALTATQGLYLILEQILWVNLNRYKLPDLFAGIRHEVFFEMLNDASTAHVTVLKNEAASEPIQHQLTMIHNELLVQSKEIEKTLELLEHEIAFLQVSEMGLNDKKIFEARFELLADRCHALLEIIQKALTIAWNSNRADLIEKLSLDKEHLQKFISDTIGQARTETAVPRGIFELLEWKLFSVYGDPSDPVQELSDDTPVLEALAQIGVRHLNDYYQLGLLPSIKKSADLELSFPTYNEENRQAHHLKLNQEAERSLKERGLNTLHDLKTAGIFSKKSLVERLSKKS